MTDSENEISLLRCLIELINVPKHIEKLCGTNNCDRCNWDYYAEEYLKLNKGLFWLKDYLKEGI